MNTTKAGMRPGSTKTKSDQSAIVLSEKPVALTVKVDDKTYIRLCTLGATQRRTNQDILREAVQQYLDRIGA
jgi:hypothetical protein